MANKATKSIKPQEDYVFAYTKSETEETRLLQGYRMACASLENEHFLTKDLKSEDVFEYVEHLCYNYYYSEVKASIDNADPEAKFKVTERAREKIKSYEDTHMEPTLEVYKKIIENRFAPLFYLTVQYAIYYMNKKGFRYPERIDIIQEYLATLPRTLPKKVATFNPPDALFFYINASIKNQMGSYIKKMEEKLNTGKLDDNNKPILAKRVEPSDEYPLENLINKTHDNGISKATTKMIAFFIEFILSCKSKILETPLLAIQLIFINESEATHLCEIANTMTPRELFEKTKNDLREKFYEDYSLQFDSNIFNKYQERLNNNPLADKKISIKSSVTISKRVTPYKKKLDDYWDKLLYPSKVNNERK